MAEDHSGVVSEEMEQLRVEQVTRFAEAFGDMIASFLDTEKSTSSVKTEVDMEPVLLSHQSSKKVRLKWKLKMEIEE